MTNFCCELIKNALFGCPWRINIERAKAYTRGYAVGDGEAMVIRRAMPFAHCCETMPVIIRYG